MAFIVKRIYADYLKKSKLDTYKNILQYAKEHDYRMVGISKFIDLIPTISNGEKILINRHDIDTSPKVAADFFDIEKEVYGHDGDATYYFRKSTINCKLISEINTYGYETGYHYEEMASYEKIYKYKDVEKIRRSLPEIREIFLKDLNEFREVTGSKSETVSAHGDFVNVIYNLSNREILFDDSIRKKANIKGEAYDENIEKMFSGRYADHVLGDKFASTVCMNIDKELPIIMLLTHPRNWKVDVFANTRENFIRLYQGLSYKL